MVGTGTSTPRRRLCMVGTDTSPLVVGCPWLKPVLPLSSSIVVHGGYWQLLPSSSVLMVVEGGHHRHLPSPRRWSCMVGTGCSPPHSCRWSWGVGTTSTSSLCRRRLCTVGTGQSLPSPPLVIVDRAWWAPATPPLVGCLHSPAPHPYERGGGAKGTRWLLLSVPDSEQQVGARRSDELL